MNSKNTDKMNEIKQKTIYDLDLHESTIVKTNGTGYPYEFEVIRVAGGWFYIDSNPRVVQPRSFFVAFNNEFQKVKNVTIDDIM